MALTMTMRRFAWSLRLPRNAHGFAYKISLIHAHPAQHFDEWNSQFLRHRFGSLS
jgi:hypothetical protein